MRSLDTQGLVVSRTGPGGGNFVHEVSRERARALLGNFFYFRNLTLGELYQIRRLLEPELVASPAGKLDPAQLDALLASCDPPATSVEEECEQHVALLKFHSLLAEFAENELLGFLIGFMAQILTDLTVNRKLYAPPNVELRAKGRADQLLLIEALREGDDERAGLIMADHLATAEALMAGQEAEVLKQFMRPGD
ncbi:FCD domain-containing protein [Pseudooceanicola sp.]|uniref:FadR/GntR family transcriptional regulator n=1 Tax=Pseudooceanicola sp. TaxID=1914328 RepID=UPI00344485F3